MNRNRLLLVIVYPLWALTGCQPAPAPSSVSEKPISDSRGSVAKPQVVSAPAPAPDSPVSKWETLMPEDARILRPPPVIRGMGIGQPTVQDGLIDDSGSGTLPGMVIDHSSPNRAEQFGSSEVVSTMEGREVSLDGFVVPLESDDEGRVRELLFVPFYGACIHVPPPPPNQIIRVVLAKPIKVPELWDAFHLSGRLHVARFDADIASATYEAQGAKLAEISG